MIVIIGDTHIKSSEYHLYGLRKLFEWLLDNYKDANVISLGDIYDVSSPHNSLESEFIGYFKQFKSFHILEGNHTLSKRSGSALQHLTHHDNIHVYQNKTEIEIEDNKFLILPWKYNAKEEYEKLEGKYDYILTHVTPPQVAFGDEGIQLNLKGIYIHGHTHMQSSFVDINKQKHFVVGIPVVTRNGENQEYQVLTIDNKVFDSVKVPVFFEYETLEYPELPKNKNNILNIIKAPSYEVVYEKYRGYNIRHEGIKLLMTEGVFEQEEFSFESGNLIQKFQLYAKEKSLQSEFSELCLNYITSYNGNV